MAGQDDRPLGRGDLGRGELELARMAVHVRPEAGQPGDDLVLGRVGRAGLLLEGVLGDVDVDRARPPGPGDVERLGDDARQVVGVADQVVVLGHRQGDAVDVDLLEGVLADQRAGHVAGDRDDRHGVQERRPDAGDEVRRARAGRAHAHARPARSPGRSRRRRARRPARGGRGRGAAPGSRRGCRTAAGSRRPGTRRRRRRPGAGGPRTGRPRRSGFA